MIVTRYKNEGVYGIIYLITNQINGKVYIGQTVKGIKVRWKEHLNESKFLRSNSPIYKAIRKYGGDNFTIEQIDCNTSMEDLNASEIFWINSYCSKNKRFGYNVQCGGAVNDTAFERHKAKSISEKQNRKKKSKYEYVRWRSERQCWYVSIKLADRYIVVSFKDEEVAAKGGDQLNRHFFGDDAYQNFPNIKEDVVDINKYFNKKEYTSSKYNGVSWTKNRLGKNHWVAYCCIDGKPKTIGSYFTEIEAAIVFDKYVLKKKLSKYTDKLNFPEKLEDYKKELGIE